VPIIIVFNVVWPFVNAFLRFRVKEASFFKALLENYKWGIMMSVFMGGLSIHLTTALLSHLFSINVNWGATSKTLENSSFSRELPKIWKQFKWLYLFLFLLVAMMIAIAFAVPQDWRITGLVPTICLAWLIVTHALLPVVLNPQSYLSELHN
jgi:fluoride ion exporter CrcB/FEX